MSSKPAPEYYVSPSDDIPPTFVDEVELKEVAPGVVLRVKKNTGKIIYPSEYGYIGFGSLTFGGD
jgi:hypothetical protein